MKSRLFIQPRENIEMRSSRIARQTALVAGRTSADASAASGRQTRAFARALRRYAAPGPPDAPTHGVMVKEEVEVEAEAEAAAEVDVKLEDEDTATPVLKRKRTASPLAASSPNVKARKRRPARQITQPNGTITAEPPLHWEEVYSTIKTMRASLTAPVDTMGCERLADPLSSPNDQRFQTLVALMLSSQTRDAVTAAAIRALQTSLPAPGLTVQNIRSIPHADLNALIRPVGFHNTKTVHLKLVAETLFTSYESDIPRTLEGLLALPGVGPKMAHLTLSAAWQRTEGIGVDVHVHRITNLLGWHATKTPEQTRLALEAWLPRDRWHEINSLLVGLGQVLCKPVGRECWRCEVGRKGLCPGRLRGAAPKPKKGLKEEETERRGEEVKEEEGDIEDLFPPSRPSPSAEPSVARTRGRAGEPAQLERARTGTRRRRGGRT
ncbi:MAG: DNA N-glycosylase and apurinic/apyrimidinic (AP) lyase [Thelocarpon impressellum]|nr:MAG: DNA N-glycosylase and apurinic/apyrimidinic (AP) lyase [Thelocarpon impressellum]